MRQIDAVSFDPHGQEPDVRAAMARHAGPPDVDRASVGLDPVAAHAARFQAFWTNRKRRSVEMPPGLTAPPTGLRARIPE